MIKTEITPEVVRDRIKRTYDALLMAEANPSKENMKTLHNELHVCAEMAQTYFGTDDVIVYSGGGQKEPPQKLQ